MRPRTGQRKLGMALAACSALIGLSASTGALGVAKRALCGDSIVATVVGAATGASARGATDAGCSPISGMTMRSPTRTMVSGGILLARAMTITGLP